MVPIRFITAFAFDLNGLMVTSGIRATAGERNIAIDIKDKSRKIMNITRELVNPKRMKKITAAIVPIKINGVRRPNLVRDLSEMLPKSGNINTAKMLSSAIITPDSVCFI